MRQLEADNPSSGWHVTRPEPSIGAEKVGKRCATFEEEYDPLSPPSLPRGDYVSSEIASLWVEHCGSAPDFVALH